MASEDLSAVLIPTLRRSLAEDVIERLRQAIVEGRLAPGNPLREEQLAESLGVSRGPVRVALQQLEREGLVMMRRNRTALVARLSLEDLDEVYSLRVALERLAVQRAVANPDPAAWAEMQSIINSMDIWAAQAVTEREAADLDTQFHEILCRTSKHQRLYNCWLMLQPQINIFLLTRNVAHPDFRTKFAEGHQAVLDAIQGGDEAHALQEIESHLRYGYNRVISSYKTQIANSETNSLKPGKL